MYGDGVFGLIEQHAMVAGAQAQQSFELAGERFHPAFAGLGVAVQRTQYRHGGALLNRTNLGRNAGCKPDSFHSGFVGFNRLCGRGLGPS